MPLDGNYSVIATDANSVSQGEVALYWRDKNLFGVGEVKEPRPNVIAFQLVTGRFLSWEHIFHPRTLMRWVRL